MVSLSELRWVSQGFDDFDMHTWYEVCELREAVFAIEQDCVYNDFDNRDQVSLHLMSYDSKGLVAYARMLPPGTHYAESSIGRVIVAKSWRGTGLGHLLMEKAIAICESHFPEPNGIRIEAQTYLRNFYGQLGFLVKSESYIYDGIPHTEMWRPHGE